MSSFVIEGGRKLSGEITPQGAKNEALQVIAATLLTPEPVEIANVPEIRDVKNLIALLEQMGVSVKRIEKGRYNFQAKDIDLDYTLSDDFIKRCAALRGSVLVVGPLLGRFGKAYYPTREETKYAPARETPTTRGYSTKEPTANISPKRGHTSSPCPKGARSRDATCSLTKPPSPAPPTY